MEVNKLAQNEVEVRLEVKLNLSNSNELKRTLMELKNQGVNRVTLNFEATEEIDSSGLGKILFFSETFRESNGSFKITNVRNPEVKNLFELIQLGKIITIE